MKSRTLFNGILMVVLVVWGMSFGRAAQAAAVTNLNDSGAGSLRKTKKGGNMKSRTLFNGILTAVLPVRTDKH